MNNKLLIFLILIPIPAFAQPLECPDFQPEITINTVIKPTIIHTHLSSKQMPRKITVHNAEKEYILGGLHSQFIITITYIPATITHPNKLQCLHIGKINYEFKLVPAVYIATEAQQYECTQDVVMKHELAHYNNAIKSINIIHKNSKQILHKYYSKTSKSFGNNLEITQLINQQHQLIFDDMTAIVNKHTTPYDKQIDIYENRKKEYAR